MVAASHLRSGGVLHPGLTAAQQLGLELMSQRDVAYYSMQEQAAAQAARISAIAGLVPKRLKPNEAFTNPARVMDAVMQGSAGDFGRNTFA
jgi:ethanolamine ammonia-lyase large subunit